MSGSADIVSDVVKTSEEANEKPIKSGSDGAKENDKDKVSASKPVEKPKKNDSTIDGAKDAPSTPEPRRRSLRPHRAVDFLVLGKIVVVSTPHLTKKLN